MTSYQSVCPLAEIPPGTCRSVDVGEKTVALFNVEGQIYALDNTCPHAGGPLGEGMIDGNHVICPWHGWKFDITTGVCQKNPHPSWTVPSYDTQVIDQVVHVKLISAQS